MQRFFRLIPRGLLRGAFIPAHFSGELRMVSPFRTSGVVFCLALVFASAVALRPAHAAERIVIHWWHAMGGQLGEAVEALAKQFNDSQPDYEVRPLRKGTYAETLTAAIAAYRAKQPPHIVQVYEVGTQTMLLSGAVYPVYQLMKDQQIAIDWQQFIPPVLSYYTKDGNLYSMPFNSSTPILYYNKDAFVKAGLDPDKPPATWQDVALFSKKLMAAGAVKCGFSIGWPSWTMVENMHAWHDQPFATQQNGFGSLDTQLQINGEFGVKHIGQLAAWQQDNIFSYGGRRGEADPKFVNGECAMYIQSSALIGGFARQITFPWGTGELPHWGAPYKKQNSIIGGATLWVMQGHKPAENKGIAQFLAFLAATPQQKRWHQQTGYLAISKTALEELRQEGHFTQTPVQWTAFSQMTRAEPTANTGGIRLGNFVQLRDIIEAELENIFAGKKTAKQGLDEAVQKSNAVLKEFVALYK
jgi:sn-glycerol 3-phosphate transport system substrate-binding protein